MRFAGVRLVGRSCTLRLICRQLYPVQVRSSPSISMKKYGGGKYRHPTDQLKSWLFKGILAMDSRPIQSKSCLLSLMMRKSSWRFMGVKEDMLMIQLSIALGEKAWKGALMGFKWALECHGTIDTTKILVRQVVPRARECVCLNCGT